MESVFRQFRWTGTYWIMIDAQGTHYTFGSSVESRTLNVRWHLDRAQDRHGNTVTFSYTHDGGTLYLKEVQYTGFAPTGDNGVNRVEFEYEPRPDRRVSYRLGVRQEENLRLHQVSVFVKDDLVRRYALSSVESPSTHRSLLKTIVLTGADDESQVTARAYEYQTREIGWTPPEAAALPVSFNASDGRDLGVRAVDVDGDNCVDLVENGTAVRLGDCHGGFTPSGAWTASIQQANVKFIDGGGRDQGVRLVDVDGDLRPDLAIARSGLGEVYLNTGSGWERDAAYSASLAAVHEQGTIDRGTVDPNCGGSSDAGVELGSDGGIDTCENTTEYSFAFTFVGAQGESGGGVLADINADGLPDLLWSAQRTPSSFGSPSRPSASPINVFAVYLNTGVGFERDAARSAALAMLPTGPFVIDSQPQGYDVLDLNGDGVADILRTVVGKARVAFLGSSSGWIFDGAFSESLEASNLASTDGRKNLGLVPIDFNGDGLLDYLRLSPSLVRAYRNHGVGWMVDEAATAKIASLGLYAVDSDGLPAGLALGDINGDGQLDILQSRQGQPAATAMGLGPVADILKRATTALGEQTAIQYLPSSSFNHTNSAGRNGMPFVLPVVSAFTRSDGRGTSFTTTMNYSGGLVAERGFKGFAASSALDSRGVTERVRYIQTGVVAGQADSTEVLDTDGKVRSRKKATYEIVQPISGVRQVRVVLLDEQTIDPDGYLHTRVVNGYDDFLNLTSVEKEGDIEVAGDETRTVIQYALNIEAGMVAFPSRVSVFGSNGKLLSESVSLYDGLREGEIEVGDATSLVDTLDFNTGKKVTRTLEYDAFGNVTRATDRGGNVTVFGYDRIAHTFRVSATDAEGIRVGSDFDLRFGSAVLEMDPSGNVTRREYDAFGRLVRETLPGDECSPNGTRTFTYTALGNPSVQFVQISATQTPGESNTFQSCPSA